MSLSKYQKEKANISNYIFHHFEFVVCFAPLSHEVERNIILELSSTAASMKLKLESGDTPTRRVWLCKDPHSSVVGAVYVHILRTLTWHSQVAAVEMLRTHVGPTPTVGPGCNRPHFLSGEFSSYRKYRKRLKPKIS